MFRGVSILLLCMGVTFIARGGENEPGTSSAGTEWQASLPIQSRAGLNRYLRHVHGSRSPLSVLSSSARRRFLSSLVFNENGLVGYSYSELQYAMLTREELRAIFDLFGAEPAGFLLENAPDSRADTGAGKAASPESERRFDVFLHGMERSKPFSPADRVRLREHYAANFPLTPDWLRAATAGDLELAFRAAALTAEATGSQRAIRDMYTLVGELQRLGVTRQDYQERLYDILLTLRRFAEARELAAGSAFLPETPEYRDLTEPGTALPTVLRFDPEKNLISRYSVDLDRPALVLVLASPYCHFCQDAIRDIERHPVLGKLMSAHSIWVAPPDDSLDIKFYRKWNQEHPIANTGVLYARGEWPMPKAFRTPVFYFLKQGEPVAKVVGWRGAQSIRALEQGMREIGLLE